METHVFQPADILLPADADMTRWSVIACDQYTSDADYWRDAEALVGTAPSTLRLMLPEFYLGKCNEEDATARIQNTMREYLSHGVFCCKEHSFILVERTLPSGKIRCGLVGMVDLEAYDYKSDTASRIRATEATVETRLPPRVKVRSEAALEMPHIMLFFRDAKDQIMCQAKSAADEVLYDFDLMLGGGHVTGRRISGARADRLASAIASLTGASALQYAVGDGNHSLAAARMLWLQKREQLDPSEWDREPARYALAEIVNIHDPSITFEPIHRALLHTDAASFIKTAEQTLCGFGSSYSVTLVSGNESRIISVSGDSFGSVIENVDAFCRDYISNHGGEVDYIHGDDAVKHLAAASDAAGILLPYMKKDDLFSSVEKNGPLPKKSFSIGLGPDKRYYLECRKLK